MLLNMTLPQKWDEPGMDWENPDLMDCRYSQALFAATDERYRVIGLEYNLDSIIYYLPRKDGVLTYDFFSNLFTLINNLINQCVFIDLDYIRENAYELHSNGWIAGSNGRYLLMDQYDKRRKFISDDEIENIKNMINKHALPSDMIPAVKSMKNILNRMNTLDIEIGYEWFSTTMYKYYWSCSYQISFTDEIRRNYFIYSNITQKFDNYQLFMFWFDKNNNLYQCDLPKVEELNESGVLFDVQEGWTALKLNVPNGLKFQ